MRGKERPIEEAQRQLAFWSVTPILTKDFNSDNVKHFDRQLSDWDPFIPTQVILDTPLLNMNKNGYSLNDTSASISTPNSGPSKTFNEPFDT